MIIQAVLKTNKKVKYRLENVKNKREAFQMVIAKNDDPNRYEWEYVYKDMARKPYSAGYKDSHRKAALKYYHKNKNIVRKDK